MCIKWIIIIILLLPTYTWAAINSGDRTHLLGLYRGFWDGDMLSQGVDDTITLTDSSTKKPGKVNIDTLTLTDATSKYPKNYMSDILTFADSRSYIDTMQRADTMTISDLISKKPQLGKADTITFSDATAKTSVKALADTIVFTDEWRRNLSDVIEFTDSLQFQFAFLIADTLNLADDQSRVLNPGTFHWTKNLGDILTLVDSLAKTFVRPLSDIVTIIDVLSKKPNKGISDAVTLSDNFGKTSVFRRTLSETLSLADAKVIQDVIGLAETLLLTDLATADLNLGSRNWRIEIDDEMPLEDAIQNGIVRLIEDVFGLSEDIVKSPNRRNIDTFALVDTFSRINLFNRTLADTLTYSDFVYLPTAVTKVIRVLINIKSPSTDIDLKAPSVNIRVK